VKIYKTAKKKRRRIKKSKKAHKKVFTIEGEFKKKILKQLKCDKNDSN